FSPELVATDGETIAVTAGRDVYVCNYGEESFTLVRTMKTNIMGIACVYGSVYFVTDNYVYGKIGSTDEAVRTHEGNINALTSDLYGNIYVAYGNAVQTTVYRFTEEEFTRNGADGTAVATFHNSFTCLRADFESNLYYLANGSLYKNGEALATIDGNDFVYRGEEPEAVFPTTFALGFEDDEIYFTFGNFCVKNQSGVLDVPSLKKIALENTIEQAFAPHEPENLFVEVSTSSVGILIDLDELQDKTDYFPYLRYYRTSET
ncbi:MAG: hypothetical protein K2N74_00270, partial [Clostridiales bacterium]|nr:hypothetical protein [Clostridiales bacterium]